MRQGRGGQYYAQCPAHDDKNPSLSIKDDNGYAVIHCHAGCEYGDIIGALGLNGEAAHPGPHAVRRRGRPPKGYAGPPLRWLAEYCDIELGWIEGDRHLGAEGQYVVFRFIYQGREIARKLRLAGTKDIRWEPVGGLTPPLWPIPEAPGTHIVVCEGETDVLILRSRGVEAYSVTKGAQAGVDETLAASLHRKGVRTVSVLFDADDAGRKGADKVRKILEAAGIAVDVVDLSEFIDGASGGKDVRDLWRADKAAFARLLARLHDPQPAGGGGGGKRWRRITGKELMEMDFPLPTWRIAGLLPEAGLTILAAEAKLGKTWLALQLAKAVAGGQDAPLGRRVMSRGRVLYLSYEDGLARLRDRMTAQGWDSDALTLVEFVDGAGVDLASPHAREELANEVRAGNIKLVVIDTLKAALRDGRVEENQAEFSNTLYALREAVCGAGASLLIIHHHRKARAGDVSADMRGTSALSGAADMMLGLYRRDGKTYLDIRGRDLPTGDQSLQVRFCKESCAWVLSEEKPIGDIHRRIMEALRKGPLTVGEMQAIVNFSKSALYDALGEMQSWGWVRVEERRTGGRPARVYVCALPEAQPAAPHTEAQAHAPPPAPPVVVAPPPPAHVAPSPAPWGAKPPAAPAAQPVEPDTAPDWDPFQRVEFLVRERFAAQTQALGRLVREALEGVSPKSPMGRVWTKLISTLDSALRLQLRGIIMQAQLALLPEGEEKANLLAEIGDFCAESKQALEQTLALITSAQTQLQAIYQMALIENAPGGQWYAVGDIIDKLRGAGFADLASGYAELIQPFDAYKARRGLALLAWGVWERRRTNPEGFQKVWPRMTECLQMALGDKWANLLNCQDSYGQAG